MVKKFKQIKSKPQKMRKLTGINAEELKKQARDHLYNSEENDENKDSKKKDSEILYNREYSKYIREEFNSKIVNMVIIFLNRCKNFPKKFKTEPEFIKKFIDLIKYLLLNELEVVALTLLLENLGWEYKNIDHWMYFCILGIYAKYKVKSEDQSCILIDKFKKNNEAIEQYYSDWLCDNDNKLDEIINLKTINEKFKSLNRPTNTFCRKNFIDYNGVVDKIIKLSQPYGEQSNGNKIKINEEWEIKHPQKQENINNQINENFNINNNNNYNFFSSDPSCFRNDLFLSNNLASKSGIGYQFLNINNSNTFRSEPFVGRDPNNYITQGNLAMNMNILNPMNFTRNNNDNNNIMLNDNRMNLNGNNYLFM